MKYTIIENPEYSSHVQQYGQYLQIMNYAPVSVEGSKALMLEFFSYLENQGIWELPQQPKTIDLFMHHLRSRPNERFAGKGLSEGHRAKFWQAIRNFDQYLRHTGQGGLNMPERDIQNTPVNQRDIGQILTQDEIRQLYQACDTSNPVGIRDRAMLSLFYGCGLRRKEGLSLEVSDLKFSSNLIHVREGKFRKERYVPMGKQVKDDLYTYLLEGRPYLLKDNTQHTDAKVVVKSVLISQRGRTPTGETLGFRLKHLQDQTSNPVLQSMTIGLHILRHSIATHLLQQGMSLKRIAQFLGHAYLESTQVYTHMAHGKL
ncbi:integrase/recombinase XerC/integrase/recombinase XerD [Dyadobacter jejuensis]|uniref:Integrase/recombinase XerC/integrase/recombinase XerD n=1 Tax=Dyadobacter jejuensis TaxID=1082580 RepID=A0A316ASL1_9BACT|nr:tyrosine-type recombinase/integrase [Dyadobacter jejuensis]PWJ53087.1 integrase/recombinase XerC/integrase/recombinase XerD [Dyadobacter jejuensis]